MTPELFPLDDTRAVLDVLDALKSDIASGAVTGLALVVIRHDGFVPVWHASPTLGQHTGSILRGAVCWLGAEMDARARDA